MRIIQNKIARTIVFSIGVLSLVTGVIGVFLPLLPTTPFILLAAWCFVKTSRRATNWIYNQRHLGPILKDWQERQAISRRTKALATTLIALSLIFMWIKVSILPLKIAVSALMTAVTAFILTRNNS